MQPWGGWTLWPHCDPNPTITLTFIPPPTSKFNPNTDSQAGPHPSTWWPVPPRHICFGIQPLSEEKKDDEIWLPDEIHSISQWSATVRQMLIFRHWSENSSVALALAPPRMHHVPAAVSAVRLLSPLAGSYFHGNFVRHEIRLCYTVDINWCFCQ